MFYLTYSSRSKHVLNDDDLKLLLDQSRRKNIFRGITGILFYFEGRFIQLLEGEEKAVRKLYLSICDDDRHGNVILHKEGFMDERLFPDWTMAFKPISPADLEGARGFRDMTVPDAANVASVEKLYHILGGGLQTDL